MRPRTKTEPSKSNMRQKSYTEMCGNGGVCPIPNITIYFSKYNFLWLLRYLLKLLISFFLNVPIFVTETRKQQNQEEENYPEETKQLRL
jgi:hypothetical protein